MFMFRLVLLVGAGYVLGTLYGQQVLSGLAVCLIGAAVVGLDLFIFIWTRRNKSRDTDKPAQ